METFPLTFLSSMLAVATQFMCVIGNAQLIISVLPFGVKISYH
jgi:hypothetical protein